MTSKIKVTRYVSINTKTTTDYTLYILIRCLIFFGAILIHKRYFQKDVALSFSKISKQKAFEQLVPDSWLSPKKENAATFLEWFATLNCYQITYSQTNEMVASVTKIFNDDV